VILTKTEQVGEEIDDIRKILYEWISPESVFTAKVEVESWMEMTGGGLSEYVPGGGRVVPDGKFISFSAIGNPQSFYRSLLSMGLDMVENCVFRDHHMFDWSDIDSLERMAYQREATAFICTEKDLQNMPPNPSLLYPLYIPRIGVSIDEEERFWKAATSILKPKLIVASNGYGEDAMGSLLAAKLKDRFPEADVSAFALVGVGREYLNRGIDVISPESEMPSAGIVKYSLKALLGDFRHGLKKLIKKQIEVWRTRQGKFRTPICVGDVYLMAHTLWGQGISPILVATAKSAKLRGHWLAERFLMRRRAERVWTRDEETAYDLSRSGIDAVFRGNPIMDLAVESDEGDDPWEGMNHPHVMLLPGSRPRAYQDTPMLMKAVRLISEKIRCGFIMVVAPTIDMHTLLSETDYHIDRRGRLALGDAEVAVYTGPISSVAYGADLLIGLGGTANQVSSGLGVPVISVIERGKLVQKKLLGDSEILTQPDASALADKAVELLGDPVKRLAMSRAGIEIMGGAGALSSVTEYAADELGWDARCKLFRTLEKIWFAQEWQCAGETGDHSAREEKLGWKITDHLASKVMKLVKIIK
jgi:tetraacyldisaccharide 4'-kinase